MRSPKAAPDSWTRGERALLRRLSTPARVQEFLDGLQYRAEERAACPRNVLVERRAHCFDGAILAAAALAEAGHPPLLLDLWAVRDDDHVLAIYKVDRCWGAVAKSNFAGLRFREPIYRTLRELALSYFELYFNLGREKTLRAFSTPMDLRRYDRLGWRFRDEPLVEISDRLDALRHTPLLTRAQLRRLTPVDRRSMESGMVGTLTEGVYGAAKAEGTVAGCRPARAAR